MQATRNDLEVWNQCCVDGRHALGGERLYMLEPHGTYAALLPDLNKHWAIKQNDADSMYTKLGAPDCRVALKILEHLHNLITTATLAPLEPALHCRYLYTILVLDNGKKVPHYAFHEIVGVLGSFVKSCLMLQDMNRKEPIPPGFGSVAIYLEILLSKFLESIAMAIHIKFNKWDPF